LFALLAPCIAFLPFPKPHDQLQPAEQSHQPPKMSINDSFPGTGIIIPNAEQKPDEMGTLVLYSLFYSFSATSSA